MKRESFLLSISSVNMTKSAVLFYDLATVTEKIFNEKLHFLCSDIWKNTDRTKSWNVEFFDIINLNKSQTY